MHERLKTVLDKLRDERIPVKGILALVNGGKSKHLPPVTEADVVAARAELAKAAAAVADVAGVVEGIAGAVADLAVGVPAVADAAEAVERVADMVGDVAEDVAAPDPSDPREMFRAAVATILAIDVDDSDRGPMAERIRAVKAALSGPVPARVADDAPSHVRVTANGSRTLPKGPAGRPLMVNFRGVYRGDVAAWLWANHRQLVEPFDPTPRKSGG